LPSRDAPESPLPAAAPSTDPDGVFLHAFDLAARQAGAVALHLQGEVTVRQKEGETTPESAALTMVDLATQDVILLLMRDAFADVAADAEEETATRDLFPPEATGRPLVVVDPIDGSLNYTRGSDDFAVMGGWLREGGFQAALVHFPAWRRTFWGRRDGGAWVREGDGTPVPARLEAPRDRVLVTPRLPASSVARLEAAGFTVEISRCSAVDATAPLNGRAAAAVATGPSSRRRPSALFVTLCAGGSVLFAGVPWRGEDPAGRLDEGDLIVSAADAALAARVHEILSA
jgi:fructose-1,6-bisphosphatase/inositol monophosphatase family enzyme